MITGNMSPTVESCLWSNVLHACAHLSGHHFPQCPSLAVISSFTASYRAASFHFSILVISQTFINLYFKVLYIICMALPKYHTDRWNGITHHRKAPFSFPRGSSQQNWLILHLVVTSSFFYGRTKVLLSSLIYKNQGRKERKRIGLLRLRNEE